ncbi:MAG TPA: nucleotide exchange factor GrpE [Candidatus Glassbacteria bacterium]|nr:nucleotide exchange factor GrpE [Candidatus Glassbacteria bacterium]
MSKSADRKKKKDIELEADVPNLAEVAVEDSRQVEPEQATPEAEISAEKKLAELQDKYLRALAELDNFKKRAEKEKAELAAFIKTGLLRDILSVVDDFDRFFHHAEATRAELDASFVEGVELIHKSLVRVLEKHNVGTVDQAGVPVDYNIHEAVMTEAVQEKEKDQTVAQVLEVGYKIGDRLIRPAKVKVAVFSG